MEVTECVGRLDWIGRGRVGGGCVVLCADELRVLFAWRGSAVEVELEVAVMVVV